MSARALTCARMLVLGLWVWLSLLHQCKAASAVSDSGLDLCSQSFCKCPEAGKQVICSCTNTSQVTSIIVSGTSSLILINDRPSKIKEQDLSMPSFFARDSVIYYLQNQPFS